MVTSSLVFGIITTVVKSTQKSYMSKSKDAVLNITLDKSNTPTHIVTYLSI